MQSSPPMASATEARSCGAIVAMKAGEGGSGWSGGLRQQLGHGGARALVAAPDLPRRQGNGGGLEEACGWMGPVGE